MQHNHEHHDCHHSHKGPDWLLWGSLGAIVAAYGYYIYSHTILGPELVGPNLWLRASATVVNLMHKMAPGLVVAIVLVGLFDFIPRSHFHRILGTQKGVQGILRATLAGVLLDLCSHGILLVGMKLYERGASLGQVIAFLVASPWNSLSFTLILWSLVGGALTFWFIVLSCVVAVLSGLLFEWFEKKGILPSHAHPMQPAPKEKEPWFVFPEVSSRLGLVTILIKRSLHESKMILRWIFFGVVLTAAVKEIMSPENFQAYFGPDATGLLLTVVAATILEVCSEGSAPLASELVTTAKAPGNAFTFLMTGVSTDYTEIMALKETTRSWKVALFLPLVTVPQIVLIGLLLNGVSV